MLSLSVFGIGEWGYNHLRTFQALPGVKVAAVCDLSDKLLEKARQQYPATPQTKDAGEAIERAEAVVIASSAKTHYALARRALEAGRHVFVEKPLALKVEEGAELVALAEKAGKVLMVGHLLLYHPAVLQAKALIEAGEIGRPLYLYTQRLNLGRIRSDENVVWSLAQHDVSLALFFFGGAPASVAARGQDYLQPGVQDTAFLTLDFPDKRMAHTHVSWLDPHKVRRLTIVGDKKMLVFDDMEGEEKLKIYDKGAEALGESALYGVRYGEIRSPRVEMKEPLRLEAEHFVDCVKSGRRPRSDGKNGLDVLRVLAASDRSLAKGGAPVPL
jgi:predicted dehydrogenase